ncbi:hypothetical protein [Herpetosiphon sp.]|uniref:hypothetical protein n=1 Tax=Herpetosiphon sp. TaxID=71864 RepID=UPI0002FE7F46|nr:hypothetical protein [Herpetosiphon sp.]
MFSTASYANPNVPTAATLAWSSTFASTAEGIDVWLRINVVGAAPTDNVNLSFIYQTFGQTAQASHDYEQTAWPNGTKGTITGNKRVAYIKINIKRNDYFEPTETFQVELRSDAANTVITGPARVMVTISRARLMNPIAGILESCLNGGEPNNDFPVSAGQIAINGGWCNTTFDKETVNAFDYYHLVQSTAGSITIRLENTTPDQHDIDLYLFYRDGQGDYQNYRQSINGNQQAEYIEAPLAAYTNYLIGVHWVSGSGSKIPTYRLSVSR